MSFSFSVSAVAKVLLQTRTEQLKYGLTTAPLPVKRHTFTEPDAEFDRYLTAPFVQHGTPTWSTSEPGEESLSADEDEVGENNDGGEDHNDEDDDGDGKAQDLEDDDRTEHALPATVALSDVIKSLVYFIASR